MLLEHKAREQREEMKNNSAKQQQIAKRLSSNKIDQRQQQQQQQRRKQNQTTHTHTYPPTHTHCERVAAWPSKIKTQESSTQENRRATPETQKSNVPGKALHVQHHKPDAPAPRKQIAISRAGRHKMRIIERNVKHTPPDMHGTIA